MEYPLKKFLFVSACGAVMFATLLLFPERKLTVLGTFIILSFIMLSIEHSRKETITFGLAAIGGSLLDMVCVAFGIWTHTRPDIWGIPMWLPFLWGNTALFVLQLRRFIDWFSPSMLRRG